MQLTIKGEIKGLQIEGKKIYELLQGFYIRNSNGLINGKPSWTLKVGSGFSIWFHDASEKWLVTYIENGQPIPFLVSSTSPDNSVPQEAKNWEYLDFNSGKLIMSSDISIIRGM